MSTGPLFPGYAAIPAPAEDPFRRKWDAVRSFLDVEHEAVELSLDAVAAFNERINREAAYVSEPLGLDNWQTPSQTMTSRSGDCEDFAILKYAVMKQSGLPETAMRLVFGQIKSLSGNLGHAWLAVWLEDAWRVLDNKFDQLIEPADYINWLPVKAAWSDQLVLFGRLITINEIIAHHG